MREDVEQLRCFAVGVPTEAPPNQARATSNISPAVSQLRRSAVGGG